MTEQILGVDTIVGLAGDPPAKIYLNRKVVVAQTSLSQLWNQHHIAILPYCFKCKEPLTWHRPPEKDGIMFHCPKCKRVWILEGISDESISKPTTASSRRR